MTLILLYLVVLILVAIVLFGVGSVVFGRGERLPPLPRGTTATVLPASDVTGADVAAVRAAYGVDEFGVEVGSRESVPVATLYKTDVDDDPDVVPGDGAHHPADAHAADGRDER